MIMSSRSAMEAEIRLLITEISPAIDASTAASMSTVGESDPSVALAVTLIVWFVPDEAVAALDKELLTPEVAPSAIVLASSRRRRLLLDEVPLAFTPAGSSKYVTLIVKFLSVPESVMLSSSRSSYPLKMTFSGMP